MKDKILTISIAAYNVEKYINECLDSLIVDEVLDDIEVLVIDDGSKDLTYKIAYKYEEKYPNSFKIIKKNNGGYGSTYNESIKIANGVFFKLLDGDDLYDKDGLKNLAFTLKNIIDSDIDVVFTKFNKFNNIKEWDGISYNEDLYDKKIDISLLNMNEGIPMHAITYRTDVLRKSNLKLPEHMLYTDNYYVCIPLLYTKSIIFKDFVVYKYRLGNAGQSVDRLSKIKHIDDLKIICDELLKQFLLFKEKFKISNYAYNRFAATFVDYYVFLLLKDANNFTLNEIKFFDKLIKGIDINLYICMETLDRKASKVIRLIRKSNYKFYYFIDFLYKVLLK